MQGSNANPPEWARFRVGQIKPTSKWIEPNCQPLESIDHITHIESALRAVSDGEIRAGLVFDESKLNRDRIRVVWLSPNDWSGAGGSRYGNVKFSFDWKTIILGKKYYWVESIAYKVAAARILITVNDYDGKLSSYDPSRGDGPWWFDKSDDAHYWNGNHCLEIMFEGDLSLDEAEKVDFVDHHRNYCNAAGRACPDCGLKRDTATGRFLAQIVTRRLNSSRLKWVSNGNPEFILILAFSKIKTDLSQSSKTVQFSGNIPPVDSTALPISRAILAAYSCGDTVELSALMGLLPSLKDVTESCAKTISVVFGLSDWKSLHEPL